MKLVAKAKPIRIRIKSGGEEHSSLDSLRNNLCVQDLKPLIDDRRLSRWLRQQGEEHLADAVDVLMSERVLDDNIYYFKVLCLFFDKDIKASSATDVYSLYRYWRDNNLHAKSLASLKSYLLDTYNGFKFLLVNYHDDMTDEMLFSKLQLFETSNDPQMLYLQGKMLYDRSVKEAEYKGLDKAYELINKSASFGWSEAVAFLKEVNFSFTQRRAMLTPSAEAKIKRQIEKWKTDKLGYINNMVSTDEEIVKQVKTLLREFRNILSEWSKCGWDYRELHSYISKMYQSLSPGDFFYRERRFVLDLVKWHRNKKLPDADLFQEIATKYQYPLAQYMLRVRLRDLFPKTLLYTIPFGLISPSAQIAAEVLRSKIGKKQFENASFDDQLSFILDHLFVF